MKYLVSILLLMILSCNSEGENTVFFSSEEDSAIAIIQSADSTYKVKHSSFSGKHMHSGDAAAAAHQNIPQKRRIAKKLASGYNSKRKSYRKENERRRLEIQKQKKSIDTSIEL